MADPLLNAKLPNVKVELDGRCFCRECGHLVTHVEVPLAVESDGKATGAQLIATVVTGTPLQQPCGHPLDITPHTIATVEAGPDA